MSLLPQQILPPNATLGRANPDGTVTIDKNWWLFLYNVAQNSIGTSGSSGNSPGGLPADALTELAAADSDVADTDAVVLRRQVENLFQLFPIDPVTVSPQDLTNALTLAQEPLLPSPPSQAQPSASVSPTGSPFTYTAPFTGYMSVTSGTVSQIDIIRTGVTVGTAMTSGLIPLSRADSVKITYTGAPVLNFLPSGS